MAKANQKPGGLDNLLESEMDRRQFLSVVGASALVVTGVSGILTGLQRINKRQVTSGYGSSSYGGKTSGDAIIKRAI